MRPRPPSSSPAYGQPALTHRPPPPCRQFTTVRRQNFVARIPLVAQEKLTRGQLKVRPDNGWFFDEPRVSLGEVVLFLRTSFVTAGGSARSLQCAAIDVSPQGLHKCGNWLCGFNVEALCDVFFLFVCFPVVSGLKRLQCSVLKCVRERDALFGTCANKLLNGWSPPPSTPLPCYYPASSTWKKTVRC